MVVATKGATVLGRAREDDLAAVDALTVDSYRPIQESYVAMLGDKYLKRSGSSPS